MAHLLGISGSLRAGSYNTLLVHEAARLFAPDVFTLADLHLPLYDADVEAKGLPASVRTLCDQIAAADAIVMATPEYNGMPSGVIKNMLDWVSRPRPAPMIGKAVAVLSAAAGASGGQRSNTALHVMLLPFQVRFATGQEVAIGHASQAFDAGGRLHDTEKLARKIAALRAMVDKDA